MKRHSLLYYENLYNQGLSDYANGSGLIARHGLTNENVHQAILKYQNAAYKLTMANNEFIKNNQISAQVAEIYFEAGKLSKMIGEYEGAFEYYGRSKSILKLLSENFPGFGGALGKVQHEIKSTQHEYYNLQKHRVSQESIEIDKAAEILFSMSCSSDDNSENSDFLGEISTSGSE